MVVTDAAPIVSTRFALDDGHTLERYLATGGYEGLKVALAKAPTAVADEVKAASLLGRGGAGFPAGTKWGFCPPGVWPRYLVVNGDESEPGTYKDRLLMERDPHQLIEGVLIACYAIGAAQAFLYVRGEMALAQERIAQALNDAYAAGYIGKNILGSDFSVDVVLHWGAGAYIVGEETALIESLEGNRGMPRLKPPFFPAAKGLYLQPTDRQQRRDAGQPPVDPPATAGPSSPSSGPRPAGAPACSPSPATSRSPACSRSSSASPPSATSSTPPSTAAASATATSSRPSSPAARRRRGSSRSTSTSRSRRAPWERPVRCSGRAPSSSWTTPPMPSRPAGGSCASSPASPAASARRAARAPAGWRRILRRILDGHGRPDDLDLLLDVCDNISPGIAWPPKQTTICPLGPSCRVADRVGRRPLQGRVHRLLRWYGGVAGGHQRQGVHPEGQRGGRCLTRRRPRRS